MNEKLEKLNQTIEKGEKKLRRLEHEEKMLQHQAKQLTRNERTHRLCTRGAALESYLPHPELVTDEQVSLLLKLLFRQSENRKIMEQVLAGESENPKRPHAGNGEDGFQSGKPGLSPLKEGALSEIKTYPR